MSVFDHFIGLALKELNNSPYKNAPSGYEDYNQC